MMMTACVGRAPSLGRCVEGARYLPWRPWRTCRWARGLRARWRYGYRCRIFWVRTRARCARFRQF